MGCDIEFLIINSKGKIIKASKYEFFDSTSSKRKIGCDGAKTPVEIRPSPSSLRNLNKLYDNIHILLENIGSFCNVYGLRLIAGTGLKSTHRNDYDEWYFTPIGGHIHFGSPSLLNDKNVKKLVFILDTYFTPITNLLIPRENIIKRTESTSYGKLGQHRKKVYGFEYRTPYSFLISPFYTRSLFNLAGLLANNYKKIKLDQNLHFHIQDWFSNSTKRNNLIKIFPIIKDKLLKLMKYNSPNQQQNASIISLFNIIERGKKKKDFDVIRNFGFNKIMKKHQKQSKLEIYFNPDTYLPYIRDMLNIKPREFPHKDYIDKNECLLVYGMFNPSNDNIISLTGEVYDIIGRRIIHYPIVEEKRGERIYIKKDIDGLGRVRHEMGLSKKLREKFAKGIIDINILKDMINKIKKELNKDVQN